MTPNLAVVRDRDHDPTGEPDSRQTGSGPQPPRPALGDLAAKLIRVGRTIDQLTKDRTNVVSDYDYLSAEAVLTAVREPIADAGLVLTARLAKVTDLDLTTPSGRRSILTTVHILYCWIDQASGETLELPWAGRGEDAGDKGLSKAFTSSTKTFLRQQLLIPQGDDPERDGDTDRRAAERAAGDTLASVGARRYLATLLDKRDATAAQRANLLRVLGGAHPLPEPRAAAQLERLLARLPGGVASAAIDHLKESKPFPSAPADEPELDDATSAGSATEVQQAMLQCIQSARGISDATFVRALCDVSGHRQIPASEIGPETVARALSWLPRQYVDALQRTLLNLSSDARAAAIASTTTSAPRYEHAATIVVPRPAAVPTQNGEDPLAGFRA